MPPEKTFLPGEEVLEHASLGALRAVAQKLPGLEDWRKAVIRKKPLTIYDLNGQVLFYDFTLTSANQQVGTVRVAASRVIGAPVVARQVGRPERPDWREVAERLSARLLKKYPRWKVKDARLVCYSYPKLGVLLDVLDARQKPQRLIFDLFGGERIPGVTLPLERAGSFAWSYYDSLQPEQTAANLKRFSAQDRVRRELTEEQRVELRTDLNLSRLSHDVVIPIRFATQKLGFCSHYGYSEERSHHCFSLHGQQVHDYCVLATAQMILDYYRYFYTQDQLAAPFYYNDAAGGCPYDTHASFESMSCNHLTATYDPSPTWTKGCAEIDGGHPFQTLIPGHSRACAGYSLAYWKGSNVAFDRHLFIYDPWPWNADYKVGGTLSWEDYDTSGIVAFTTLRLNYP